jgi:hypothetical protein
MNKEEILRNFKLRYLPIGKIYALNLNGESIIVKDVLDLMEFISYSLDNYKKGKK